MNSWSYGVNYSTRSFTEIFPTYDDFHADISSGKIPLRITDENLETLYYLLYAKYGNSHIASSDENRFKYNLMYIIYAYGPAWEERLSLQEKIKELDDDELMYGAMAIYNSAFNPETPTTSEASGKPTIIDYINQQNTTRYKKNKAEAYALKMEIVKTDVTTPFIDRFKKLFTRWGSELPLYYPTED